MTVISLLCATVLGVIFGLFKVSDFKILKLIADVYIDIIRGTPLLVQVMIMMYGVGSVLKPYGFQWSNIGGAFTAAARASTASFMNTARLKDDVTTSFIPSIST